MAHPDQAPPHALDRLFHVIAARRGADPRSSYTASLLAASPELPSRKLAEEAAECAVEALRGDAAALRRESADLVFHLLALLAGAAVEPDAVYAALAARALRPEHSQTGDADPTANPRARRRRLRAGPPD